MLWGILLTMLIGIPMGITEFNGIVSIPPSLEPVFFKFDFSKVLTTQMAFTVFTLLFIDMFDTIGTLVGVSNKAGMLVNGKVPRAKQAFMADAIGTTVGAMLGTNTVSTFVESCIRHRSRRPFRNHFFCNCYLLRNSLAFRTAFPLHPKCGNLPYPGVGRFIHDVTYQRH